MNRKVLAVAAFGIFAALLLASPLGATPAAKKLIPNGPGGQSQSFGKENKLGLADPHEGNPGTFCNPNNGLCERHVPDACEGTFTGRCDASNSVTATADGGVASPVAPVLTPPDPNHTAPTIVPAAEQVR